MSRSGQYEVDRTAIIDPATVLGSRLFIGPFCALGLTGPDDAVVSIGEDCQLRSHTVIYRGARLGSRVVTGHFVLIRERCIIGDDCSIGSNSILEHHVLIEDGVRIHSACFIPEYSVLRAGCWIGPGVILTNAKHPNRPGTKDNLSGVRVEEGAVVGAGVVLLPGVTVGKGALVGAGSIVADDIPAEAVVYGPKGTVRRLGYDGPSGV